MGRSGSLELTAALVLAARIVVAAAFVVAAVQKLRALPAMRAQVQGFGVPAPLVGASVAVLPVLELATAAALIAVPYSSAPAFVAVGLLAVFTGAVIGNLSPRATPTVSLLRRRHVRCADLGPHRRAQRMAARARGRGNGLDRRSGSDAGRGADGRARRRDRVARRHPAVTLTMRS